MDDRLNRILCSLVGEYIKTGVPVSSMVMARSANIKLSPATIRNEYRRLGKEGMIIQPHTSAGRVPTDKGYRCYVEQIDNLDIDNNYRELIEQEYEELADEYGRGEFALAVLLSRLSKALALASRLPIGQIEQCGLSQLLEDGDENVHVFAEVSIWLDHIRQYASQLTAINDNQTTVYIGEENPFFPSSHTSILMRQIKPATGPRVVMMVMGPKRMDYKRNIVLMEEMSRLVR